MKKEGHPQLNNVCFVDVSTNKRFITKSTLTTKKVENIDGEDYYMYITDVSMDSHPAYTGEKRFVDSAGRVEKFKTKFRSRG
tara:strand:- start:36 stop:281 length:246 start_codon:yes stop_codon:yes gene_type:complete